MVVVVVVVVVCYYGCDFFPNGSGSGSGSGLSEKNQSAPNSLQELAICNPRFLVVVGHCSASVVVVCYYGCDPHLDRSNGSNDTFL